MRWLASSLAELDRAESLLVGLALAALVVGPLAPYAVRSLAPEFAVQANLHALHMAGNCGSADGYSPDPWGHRVCSAVDLGDRRLIWVEPPRGGALVDGFDILFEPGVGTRVEWRGEASSPYWDATRLYSRGPNGLDEHTRGDDIWLRELGRGELLAATLLGDARAVGRTVAFALAWMALWLRGCARDAGRRRWPCRAIASAGLLALATWCAWNVEDSYYRRLATGLVELPGLQVRPAVALLGSPLLPLALLVAWASSRRAHAGANSTSEAPGVTSPPSAAA